MLRPILNVIGIAMSLALIGCAATTPPPIEGHLTAPPGGKSTSPPPLVQRPYVPAPKSPKREETYTVVVDDVPVRELLFALSRDASVNVDIHPLVTGNVTVNAVNQTLIQILDRVSNQVSLTYELNGPNLFITPDIAYWKSYNVDYFNLTRSSTSTSGVATRIATTGGSVGESSSDMGNYSNTTVSNHVTSEFWKLIAGNLEYILRNEGTGPPTGGADVDPSGNVVSNPNSGLINVRATHRLHREVQKFLDSALTNAKRQVLIEATIVEVELSDRYQAGIDWSVIQKTGGPRVDANGRTITKPDVDGNPIPVADKLVSIGSTMLGSNLAKPPTFLLNLDRVSSDKDVSIAVRLLETFGDAKVLSSPKIMALNNQTAMLKVVDEKVYFTVLLEIERDAETGLITNRTYSSEVHTVPIGVIMSVTPQINDVGIVSLNIRPTITRITGYAVDPLPKLQGADFENLIPEIQIREMESLLQVGSGQTVVLGGLMQNKVNKNDSGIPFLSRLPGIGALFKYKDDQFTKTELVIFLRPVLVSESMDGPELEKWRGYFPESGAARAPSEAEKGRGAL